MKRSVQHKLFWYDYGFRNYDAQRGRWHSPDPLASSRPDLTPNRYVYNNPVNYVDRFGLWEGYWEDEDGNLRNDDDITSQADLDADPNRNGTFITNEAMFQMVTIYPDDSDDIFSDDDRLIGEGEGDPFQSIEDAEGSLDELVTYRNPVTGDVSEVELKETYNGMFLQEQIDYLKKWKDYNPFFGLNQRPPKSEIFIEFDRWQTMSLMAKAHVFDRFALDYSVNTYESIRTAYQAQVVDFYFDGGPHPDQSLLYKGDYIYISPYNSTLSWIRYRAAY